MVPKAKPGRPDERRKGYGAEGTSEVHFEIGRRELKLTCPAVAEERQNSGDVKLVLLV